MSIGERIKVRRKELGISAEQLADTLGVSPATIYRYESNYINSMKVDRIKPIAKALNTNVAYLMGWEDASVGDPALKGDGSMACNLIGNESSSKFDSFYATPEEQAIISAYRACDEMGKGMVRRILNIPDDAYDIAAEVARKELEDTPAKNEELTKKDI